MADTFFCKYCGRKLDDDSLFCPRCGKQVGDKEGQLTEIPRLYNEEQEESDDDVDSLKLAANPNKRFKKNRPAQATAVEPPDAQLTKEEILITAKDMGESQKTNDDSEAVPESADVIRPDKPRVPPAGKQKDAVSTQEGIRPDKPKVPPLKTADGKIATSRIGKSKPAPVGSGQAREKEQEKRQVVTVAGKPKIPPRIQTPESIAKQKARAEAKVQPVPHDPYFDDIMPDDVDMVIERTPIDKVTILKAVGIGVTAIVIAVLMIILIS